METIKTHRVSEGELRYCRHQSAATGTPMTFSVFVPEGPGPFPVFLWLSGLTCTEDNFTTKAGAYEAAARHGVAIVAPDTSPRGEGVPGDPAGATDFGLGAGFYVDATEAPYATHYKMWTYVTQELPALIAAQFPADTARQSILGHSMGGHGALTVGLTFPERFRAVSALAPIVAPSLVPWGQKALTGYLGADTACWRKHDAVALIADGARVLQLLVDQGEADPFLNNQLKPELLEAACAKAGIPLTLRRQPGYDHGYYFVSSMMADHLAWHAEKLR